MQQDYSGNNHRDSNKNHEWSEYKRVQVRCRQSDITASLLGERGLLESDNISIHYGDNDTNNKNSNKIHKGEIIDFSYSFDCIYENNHDTNNSNNNTKNINHNCILPVTITDTISNGDDASNTDSGIDNATANTNNRHYYNGPLYTLREFPGFLYAPRALSATIQMKLAYMAVTQFCESPNITNMDSNNSNSESTSSCNNIYSSNNCNNSSMWEIWKAENGFASSNGNKGDNGHCNKRQQQQQQQQKKKQKQGNDEKIKKRKRIFKNLSWATMGYHYDWTTRAYHRNDPKTSSVPTLLKHISILFARTSFIVEEERAIKNKFCNFANNDNNNNNNKNNNNNESTSNINKNKNKNEETVTNTTNIIEYDNNNDYNSNSSSGGRSSSSSYNYNINARDNCDVNTFTPSACIVNYYNHSKKSIMGGHRDDLEYAWNKPIVSISIGLPAIFLLAGKTKNDPPVLPILVKSGDVSILGGDSRMNYHGMARVIPIIQNNNKNKISNQNHHGNHDNHHHAIRDNNNDYAATAKSNITANYVTAATVVPSNSNSTCTTTSTATNTDSITSSMALQQIILEEKEIVISELDKKALLYFLSKHRININVRQVYADE